MNYPLKANKFNRRSLEPLHCFSSEEYVDSHYDLYLTTEHTRDEHYNVHRFYRLHAAQPHNIEMALAYDIKCPNCGGLLKQVGRCQNYHDLGLYKCPICDKD